MVGAPAVQDATIGLNGLRFHYRDWGDERAPALVLLHGARGHAHQWDRFARDMADRFRVLVLDQRGHGETEWSSDYAQQRMDEDLHAFLERLALRQVALAGQSMGAVNAYLYAARHPGMVERLVIGDFGPDGITKWQAQPYLARLRATAEESFAQPEDALSRAVAANPRQPRDDLRHQLLANLLQRTDGRWAWRYDGARLGSWLGSVPTEPEQWALLACIACPTLLVRGAESDTLSRSTAERMVHTIPRCRLVESPHSGHGVSRDRPGAFLAAVRPFLLATA
jgi:pimeloyl-ACP methyl ester carboxylesterase